MLSLLKGKYCQMAILEEPIAARRPLRENVATTAFGVLIPRDSGELVALFHKYGMIEHESYEETGTHVGGHIPTNHLGPFAAPLKV